MNAFVAEAHARGDPVLEEDFKSRPIPDDQNAAVPIAEALSHLNFTRDEMLFDNATGVPERSEELETIGKMLAAHRYEIDLVRSAQSRAQVRWDVQFSHSMDFSTQPRLNQEETSDPVIRAGRSIPSRYKSGRPGTERYRRHFSHCTRELSRYARSHVVLPWLRN